MKEKWLRYINGKTAKESVAVFLFSIIAILGMEYCVQKNWTGVLHWIGGHPFCFFLTILFVTSAYEFLNFLFGFFTATWIVLPLSWIWGVVNYLKFTMREEYVIGDEVLLFLRGKLTFQKSDVVWSKHLYIYMVIVMILCLLTLVLYFGNFRRKKKKKERFFYSFCSLLITVFIGFGVYFGETIEDYGFDCTQLEKKYGLLLSFIPNNVIPHVISTKSYEPYFKEKAQENEKKDIVKPNIIIIMSESLYDTDYFDNINADKDPMKVMHHIQKTYGGGSTAVNIFGGGTANTEFEFLTGISTKYFSSCLIYNSYINKNQMSMVRYMNQMGYHTVAIHPYEKDFFNRENVYRNFGFQSFYSVENMKYNDELFDITVSDECLTKEIIDKYEKNEKNSTRPFFNFSVSVGNHKPVLNYTKGEPYKYEKKVILSPDSGKLDYIAYRDIYRYYSGVYHADQAFAQLIRYFEKVKEPTVILLFGDHAPPLSDTTYSQITKKKLTSEQLYQTPVVTWNNYGLPEFFVNQLNVNYLSTAFLEYIGFPLPKAAVYNKNLMEDYFTTNTKKAMRDEHGKKILKESADEKKMEETTLSLYQDELKMKENVVDVWDVPKEER